MKTWVDGRLVDERSAQVSVLDHGFTVGDGVFETLKAEDGRLFALPEHLARLDRSAQALGLPRPDIQRVAEACHAVMNEPDAVGLLRVRITYTGGPGPLGSERGTAGTTLVVAASQVPSRTAAERLSVVPWPRNERGAIAGVKSTSYAENAVALAWAKAQGSGEALFANTVGMLCEGTGSNVFVVIDGKILTPPLSSGCLAGITRALVLEWVDGAIEVDVPMADLHLADEVFITSSTRDVHPVCAVDGREIDAPGPVTSAVMTRWAEMAPSRFTPR